MSGITVDMRQTYPSGAHIIDIQVESAEDQFGSVSRGSLRFCGRMCKATFWLNPAMADDVGLFSFKYNLELGLGSQGSWTAPRYISLDELGN